MCRPTILDGVDFDFEWCETAQEWADYSLLIEAMNAALPASSLFSVSLHPAYYSITPAAIAAADYISIQSYGPRPNRFPYDQFVSDLNNMLAYGYPRHKLVMGLPFYGTTSDNTLITTAYTDIVKAHPNLDPNLDEIAVTANGVTRTYTFNGQTTLIKKAKLVRDQELAGLMYWDIATDVNYTNPLALLRAVNTIINANLDVDTSTPVSAQTINFPALPEKRVDDLDFDAGAVASSGLPVSYTSSDPAVATILNGKIHLTGAGTTIITANQTGNALYQAAEPVSQTLVVIADTEAPTAPANLTATATDETATLTWAAATDNFAVTGYKIFKAGELIAELNATTYTVNGLQSSISYDFVVVATDKAGNISGPAAITITTPDTQAPGAPLALTGKKTIKHEIELTWQAATDNVAVVGYWVYLNGTPLHTTPITGTTYRVPSPKGRDAYEFTVKAVDAAQNLSAAGNSLIVVKGIIVEPGATASRQPKSATESFVHPDGVVVYPNPSPGRFRVNLNSPQNGELTISLYNANGRLLKEIKDVKNDAYEKELDLRAFAAGIYFIRISVGSFVQSQRINIE
ncbi:glycosyl hydrolase family 18 protein [Adhaeribacter rhizoryzae]|uniref:glycosyl hydrolase family 18 protein n=1 Tax=Adhaeribacter rhizoryzae TaxID=2607907 RepID=UPI00167FDF61|nr:glycosyl hydrolase family 18 protein [Adhaeribacter rhizoryzae]